ncbi:MAG: 3-keto-disaccharide hydrolase, partial [Planctomycetota bacterium]
MNKNIFCAVIILTAVAAGHSAKAGSSFIGYWALTLPNGGPGWLGITLERGDLDASILWGGGSVKPVSSVNVQGDQLVITRVQVERRGANRGKRITETITATLSGDDMKLVTVKARPDGSKFGRAEFTGKRIPPLPPKPDLSKAKYGEPITLFNGKNLDGWELTDPNHANGWIAEDGVLINRPTQHEGKKHIAYGNLRTIGV